MVGMCECMFAPMCAHGTPSLSHSSSVESYASRIHAWKAKASQKCLPRTYLLKRGRRSEGKSLVRLRGAHRMMLTEREIGSAKKPWSSPGNGNHGTSNGVFAYTLALASTLKSSNSWLIVARTPRQPDRHFTHSGRHPCAWTCLLDVHAL